METMKYEAAFSLVQFFVPLLRVHIIQEDRDSVETVKLQVTNFHFHSDPIPLAAKDARMLSILAWKHALMCLCSRATSCRGKL